jgi:hypothetical protein
VDRAVPECTGGLVVSAESWAAIFDAHDGRVTLRFSSPCKSIEVTPEGARRLAAKLLLLAESAENTPKICSTEDSGRG